MAIHSTILTWRKFFVFGRKLDSLSKMRFFFFLDFHGLLLHSMSLIYPRNEGKLVETTPQTENIHKTQAN